VIRRSSADIGRGSSSKQSNLLNFNWPEITRLADEIFKHGRLDRQQIEVILAPPKVTAPAMPRRPGDEPNFYRRCDGYLIPPKKS
jgi:hypothetical protein